MKYTQLECTTNAYDVIVLGTTNEWAGTADAGLQLPFSDDGEYGAAGFGAFSGSATSYGGRISLRVRFENRKGGERAIRFCPLPILPSGRVKGGVRLVA